MINIHRNSDSKETPETPPRTHSTQSTQSTRQMSSWHHPPAQMGAGASPGQTWPPLLPSSSRPSKPTSM
eukprot:2587667-Lingulodinium_polyedra.AAC.1